MHPDCPNLLIAMLMTLPHELPLFIGATFNCELPHQCPGLFGKIAGSAHQHHGFNPARLLCSHVQEGIASTAQAYRLDPLNTQAVKQRKYVKCALPKSELHRWIG